MANKRRLSRKIRSRNRPTKRKAKKYILKGGTKKAIVFMIGNTAGFFAMYTSLFRVYLYAKKLNIPFFIEHNNWQYTYKNGWHDYLKSFRLLNNDEHFDSIERLGLDPSSNIIGTFTKAEMLEGVKETFILNDDLQAKVDAYVKDLGEYTSLYVRRGDKIDEMPLISLENILGQTTIRDDGRTLFVQTDDYTVVKDMMSKFPSCKIKTLTKETAGGANNQDMLKWSPEERKAHTEELLISCAVTARAKDGWTYDKSNVGMAIKLLGGDRMHLYNS